MNRQFNLVFCVFGVILFCGVNAQSSEISISRNFTNTDQPIYCFADLKINNGEGTGIQITLDSAKHYWATIERICMWHGEISNEACPSPPEGNYPIRGQSILVNLKNGANGTEIFEGSNFSLSVDQITAQTQVATGKVSFSKPGTADRSILDLRQQGTACDTGQ